MGITFDESKLLRVPIELVRANDWNPKKDDTEEAKRIVLSVKENGQRMPIVVREHEGVNAKGTVTPYQIIDGEQRYNACCELGFTEVLVYNEGSMEDDAAMALTIWYEQQVPFDKIMEAELASLIAHMPLPYTEKELDTMRELIEFDWEAVEPQEQTEVEFRTLTVRLSVDAYATVMEALDKVKDEEDVTIERALELICVNYLADNVE